MRQRGRKSSASLAVVPIDANQQRPEPPARLSAEEKTIWREVTAAVRSDWFWSSEFLLEIYVRAIAFECWLAAQIKVIDPGDPRFAQLVASSVPRPSWLAVSRPSCGLHRDQLGTGTRRRSSHGCRDLGRSAPIRSGPTTTSQAAARRSARREAMPPLRLSDDELDQIMAAAAPLDRDRHGRPGGGRGTGIQRSPNL